MRRSAIILVLALLCPGAGSGGEAPGEPLRVVADIAPVHALVARVMQGVPQGEAPHQLIDAGASPHAARLRPSDAAALAKADLVVFIGPELTPWLEGSAHALAPDATRIELLEMANTQVLMFREGVTLGMPDDHEADKHGHDDHGHEGRDPHAWLDPENAILWMTQIAERLAMRDPQNAALYRANAAQGGREIQRAMADVHDLLQPHSDANFVVYHDAYQYFERRFSLRASAAIAMGDASQPGPARIDQLRDLVMTQGITCVFSEPQLRQSVLDTVVEASAARLVELDVMGLGLTEGPDFYPSLIRTMARQMAGCFSAK